MTNIDSLFPVENADSNLTAFFNALKKAGVTKKPNEAVKAFVAAKKKYSALLTKIEKKPTETARLEYLNSNRNQVADALDTAVQSAGRVMDIDCQTFFNVHDEAVLREIRSIYREDISFTLSTLVSILHVE